MKFNGNLPRSESLHIAAVTKRDLLFLYTYGEASRAQKPEGQRASHGACKLVNFTVMGRLRWHIVSLHK